jgi:hypothetical protein
MIGKQDLEYSYEIQPWFLVTTHKDFYPIMMI